MTKIENVSLTLHIPLTAVVEPSTKVTYATRLTIVNKNVYVIFLSYDWMHPS